MTRHGLYYLQSRFYNPEWHRFLNADGIMGANGDLLSYNLYAYCSNNPVNLFDPSGTCAECTMASNTLGMISTLAKAATVAINGKDLILANFILGQANALVNQYNAQMAAAAIIHANEAKKTAAPITSPTNGSKGGTYPGHPGNSLDFRAPANTPIYAAMGGRVTTVVNTIPNDYRTVSGGSNSYGNYVVIVVWDETEIYYAHQNQNSIVSVGDIVVAGQQIGIVGSTGNSTGNHLHFEIKSNKSIYNYFSY